MLVLEHICHFFSLRYMWVVMKNPINVLFVESMNSFTGFSSTSLCRQQTPVSEDSSTLFGPPLETTFGEEKVEGNSLWILVLTAAARLRLSLLQSFWLLQLLSPISIVFCWSGFALSVPAEVKVEVVPLRFGSCAQTCINVTSSARWAVTILHSTLLD